MTDLKPQTPAQSERLRAAVPWRASDAVIAVAVVACVTLAALPAIARFASPLDGFKVALLLLPAHAVMLCAVWFFAVKRRGGTLAQLGVRFHGLPWTRLAGWGTLALALSLAGGVAYGAIVEALGFEALRPSPLPERLLGEGAARVVSVGVIALAAPVAEEVFFRGFLFPAVARNVGVVPGAIVASALFAAVHIDPAILLPVFGSGLILTWLYLRTRSLWPSILAHSGQNILAVTLAA